MVAACLLLVAVACTGGRAARSPTPAGGGTRTGSGEPAAGPSSTVVRGRLLMTSGDRGLQLDLLALPSTHPVALRMPGSSNFYFEQAFLGDDGTPYLLELSPATRVFSLSADGPPRALGPRLFACAGPAQLAGRTLYVDDCRAGVIHVLDLDHPSAWTTLSAGLLSSGERAVFGGFHGQPIQASASAVSPDGRVLAFLLRGPKGMELWSRPLDGSTPPHRLLSVGTLPGLREAGIDHPQVVRRPDRRRRRVLPDPLPGAADGRRRDRRRSAAGCVQRDVQRIRGVVAGRARAGLVARDRPGAGDRRVGTHPRLAHGGRSSGCVDALR